MMGRPSATVRAWTPTAAAFPQIQSPAADPVMNIRSSTLHCG
jgi:hypothetical protein